MGLSEALRLAATGHPTVQSKIFYRDGAERGVDVARRQWYPNLSTQSLAGSGGRLETVLRLEQPVWNGGRIDAEIGIAEAQRDAAGQAVGEATMTIAGRVVSAYAEIGRLRMRERAAKDNVNEHERLTSLVERRAAAGVSSPADLVLGRSRLAQARLELTQIGFQIRSALNALEQAVGQPLSPLPLDKPALPLLPTWDQAVVDALRVSPTKRRLDAELVAADSEVDARRAALYPQLVARYDRAVGGITGNGAGQVMLALTYQTGAGLSNAGMLDQARARRASMQMSIAAAERELIERVRADWLEASSQQAQSAMLDELVLGTAETSASMLRQFQAGRKSWVEVLNAQREDVQARFSLADAQWGGWYAAARLGLSMGRYPLPETGAYLLLKAYGS